MYLDEALVSIITPTYNHEKYIGQCIESVLRQSYKLWEMIIVDDGSLDNTGNIIKKYNDPRIKYFRQLNQGPFKLGETYNFALRQAKGKFIAILEGDDLWPKDKLEKQLPAFNNKNVVLSHGNYNILYEGKKCPKIKQKIVPGLKGVLNNFPVGNAIYGFANGIIPWPVTVIIRAQTLKKIGGFKQNLKMPLVDFSTFLPLALEGEFKYIPDTLGYFRRHNLAVSHNNGWEIDKNLCVYFTKYINDNLIELKKYGLLESKLREISKLRGNVINKGSSLVIHGKELVEMGDYQAARKVFRNVLNHNINFSLLSLSYTLAAYLGIIGTYCGLNLCEYVTGFYWKLNNMYFNIKK